MKIVDSFLIRNSDNVLTANTAPKVEVFHTFTHTTSAGSSTPTIPCVNTTGFSAGDTVYIGSALNAVTSTNVFTVTAVGSATSLTLSNNASFGDNNAVCVKRKTGASVDAYAEFYDDPRFTTPITFPFSADSDNEFHMFALPGRYAVRYTDADGITLQLDHDITFGNATNHIQVVPQHASATKGILEAVKKLPTPGGRVYCPAGTYTLTAALSIGSSDVSRLTLSGDGPGVTILEINAATTLLTVTGIPFRLENLTLRIASGITLTTPLLDLVSLSGTNGLVWGMKNVILDANEQTGTIGMRLTSCIGGHFQNVFIGNRTGAAAGNGFPTGVSLVTCGGISLSGINLRRRVSTAGDKAVLVSASDSVIVSGNAIENYETGVSLEGASDNNYVFGNYNVGVTTEISDTASGANNYKAPSGAVDITYTGDVVFNGGFREVVDGWRQENVAISQTDVELVRHGASPTAAGRFSSIRAGSVTGVSVISSEARTAGTLTVTVFKNTGVAGAAGSTIGLTAVLDGTNTTKKATTQAKGTDTFAAGDEIYAVITTDGTWAPTTADIRVAIEVET